MQISSRFTMALHLLACTDTFPQQTITSAFLARSIGTHPVVIRNLLLRLKKARLLEIRRGTGGIRLLKPLDKITFLDVYQAVEPARQALFRFHPRPNPRCPVGKEIHALLDGKLRHFQHTLQQQLKQQTLQDWLHPAS